MPRAASRSHTGRKGQKPAPLAGTKIVDPLGASFQGTVDEFISGVASAKSFGSFKSATMRVSPKHYPLELVAFKNEFAKSPGDVDNTAKWKISDETDLHFTFVSEAYQLAAAKKVQARTRAQWIRPRSPRMSPRSTTT